MLDFCGDIEEQSSDVFDKPWMSGKKFILGTVDNLDDIMDACIKSGRYGLDTETTGLDNRVLNFGGVLKTNDKLVGVCLSPDGETGYYIPLEHVKIDKVLQDDGSLIKEQKPSKANIPWDVFDKLFRRLIDATENGETIAVFHNGKFDHEFLNYHGHGQPYSLWDNTNIWDDTLILAHLQDPRRNQKGLKALSKNLLDMEMIELDDFHRVLPKDSKGKLIKDFSLLDPNDINTIKYAASDAICTRLLYDIIAPDVLNPAHGYGQSLVYKIEKKCIAATRWMERNRIHVDKAKIKELIIIGHKEWHQSIMDIYSAASEIVGRDIMPRTYKYLKDHFVFDDPTLSIKNQLTIAKADGDSKQRYPDPVKHVVDAEGTERPPIYDLNAPAQLGALFDEMKVPGLTYTEKSGQVKTTKTEIDRIINSTETQFPFMAKIKRFREISRALTNYLYPMYNESDPNDDLMRINFKGQQADTGRFSTPISKKKIAGYPAINFQGIPHAGGVDRPECMTRIRECISARSKDRVIVAVDYAGVELRLVTNISKEPLWMDEFFHCSSCGRKFDPGDGKTTPKPPPARCPNCGSDKIGDLHTLTGLSIYGNDAQANPNWKELRGQAKSLNFALVYGGGGLAAQQATGVDRNEGNRLKRQFDGTYKVLRAWWDSQKAFARQHGFVVTAFRRMYPLPDINHADSFFRSKAERNAINGPIQGSSADITKIAMGLIYKECKKRGWLDRVQMIGTMHDELIFDIEKEILEEALEIINPIMTSNAILLQTNWPIPLTTDIEIGYDWTVPWDLNAIKYQEVRFIGDKKFYKPSDLPEGEDWDNLSNWPVSLKPYFKHIEPTQVDPKDGDSNTSEPQKTPQPVDVVHQETPQPSIPSGEYFKYTLQSPLTIGTLVKLADAIWASKDKGTRYLKVILPDNSELNLEEHYGKIMINPTAFEVYASLVKL